MTPLLEIALEFADTCLGWEDARVVYPPPARSPFTPFIWSDALRERMDPADVGRVVRGVRECVDGWPEKGVVFDNARVAVVAVATQASADYVAGRNTEEQFLHRLMLGCVLACRQARRAA